MSKSVIWSSVSLAALVAFCVACSSPQDGDVQAADALAERILGRQAARIEFVKLDAEDADYYLVSQEGRKIRIIANNSNSMAVGLNAYLKECGVDVSWFVFDPIALPTRLPDLDEPIEGRSLVPNRFFLNYCTYGYTMPWWNWEEWEHFIDWMALQGINLPLAITGQESIWYKIWTEMGLSDEQVRSYFTGPAHLPWHRMQNIDRWGGPLPQSWLDGQLELQKKITARERELGMRPVLPAFSGHVPAELSEIYPDAPITRLEAWAGYSDEYACSFLDPMSDLYTEIQRKFIDKEAEIYGTDHIYGIDIFNELTPPSWEPDYLGRVSRQVYESLEKADPEATWLQMGWLFYNEREDWTEERVEAYLTSFPKDRQILLDYYCERQEVWRRTDSFYGVPFVWCYLGNFGGNTMLVGDLDTIDERLQGTFESAGDNFCGIGSTLEGFDCNPFVYKYLFEKAWQTNRPVADRAERIADLRIGRPDDNGRAAWKLMIDSIYVAPSTPGQCPLINIRPTFGSYRTYYANPRFKYDNDTLKEIVRLLLAADGTGSDYSFDLANMTRQWLSNLYINEFKLYSDAYEARDREEMDRLSAELLGIIDDVDRIVGTQEAFLIGKWIEDARAWGATPEEADYFESNARNLLTTWSDGNMLLNDYASRTWQGLTSTFYRVRWERFFAAVGAALDAGEDFDEEHFATYKDDICAYEKSWWDERIGSFSSVPQGDAKQIAAELYLKYSEFAKN